MNKKSAAPIAAVIEIGSNNVKLRVSQLSKGKIQTLDRLEYPIGLGHDVFENGSVSFDSLRELSAALSPPCFPTISKSPGWFPALPCGRPKTAPWLSTS